MDKLINLASWDRIARVVLGLALIVIGLFTALLPGPWNYVAAGLGLVFIITGAVAFCPLYYIFKFRTLKS